MLAGNSRHFAFWYDVIRWTPENIYGPFDIFVAGTSLLDDVDAESELMSIASDLKKTLGEIHALMEIPKYADAKNLFLRSLHEHGYLSFEDPVIPAQWREDGGGKIGEFLRTLNDLIEERRADPPFGHEILMGQKLRESGWRFFLYSRGKKEIMLLSGDHGRKVVKLALPKGSLKSAIEAFLDSEEISLRLSE
ncbi:hypothetical protein [Herbaspirillum huttiense]|uniref:hypothetical protein n=1 Tax=Herbaspirillum huttiense TaxID=863372 RepID=UPI00055322F4|nr:hypothetical protein [Herbaspirillum sp. B39]